MEKVALVQAILKQFPWGRVEKDGTFAEPVVRAYYNVLGARGFGYWSTPLDNNPQPSQPSHSSRALRVAHDEAYEHGYMLLSDEMLTDETGWKLEKRFIPQLTFEPGTEPEVASNADIVDWDAWYKWRNLPKESPAALLMHYPLSVYQLLVHVLQVTGPRRNSPESRQALDVHYLGAEVELNMLPLYVGTFSAIRFHVDGLRDRFSELALLLPYTDIKLIFFGVAVHSIVNKAKKNSVAMRAKRDETVYTYTSPASCGASTLSIFLHGQDQNWDPRLPFFQSRNNQPHAIVALNAGLNSYQSWQFVVMHCLAENIPFAVTDYAEQCVEVQKETFPELITHTLPHLLSAGMNTSELHHLIRHREYPITFNPFQRPGQRTFGSTRLPNVPNGFTLRVVGKEHQETVSAGVAVPTPGMSDLFYKSAQLSLNSLD